MQGDRVVCWIADGAELTSLVRQHEMGGSDLWAATAYLSPQGVKWFVDTTAGFRGRRRMLVGLTEQVLACWPEIVRGISDDQIEVRLYRSHQGLFHPKVLGWTSPGQLHAVVGSSNLTSGGLSTNIEANLYLGGQDPELLRIHTWFQQLWEESLELTDSALDALEEISGRLRSKLVKHDQETLVVLQEALTALQPMFPRTAKVRENLPDQPSSDIDLGWIHSYLVNWSVSSLVAEWGYIWDRWYSWFQDRRDDERALYRRPDAELQEMIEERLYTSVTIPAHRKGLLHLLERRTLRDALRVIFQHKEPRPDRVKELLDRVRERVPRGIGMATVSEILHFCWPEKYMLYNKRSARGLGAVYGDTDLFLAGHNDSVKEDYSLFYDYAQPVLAALVDEILDQVSDGSEAEEVDYWLGTYPYLVLDRFLAWIHDETK